MKIKGISILFEGFDGTSSGGSFSGGGSESATGMDLLADRIREEGLGFEVAVHEHEDQDAAIARIEEALEENLRAKVVIMGHSLGGDSAVEVAETLGAKNIGVDLLVQIDSVGVGDEVKPPGVKRAVNIFSTSGDGIDGAQQVDGSENIGLDGTTHTDIDNDPRTHDLIMRELEALLELG